MPRPHSINVLALAGVLGLALFALGSPGAIAATPSSPYGLPGTTPSGWHSIPFGGLSNGDLAAAGPAPPAAESFDFRPRLVPPALPMTPSPFDQRPVNASVAVFIPTGTAAPVPNALPGRSSTITLTFDDCGTAAQMQAIVDALAITQRKAIFFVTGQCRDHYPWLVDTLLAAGHQVCNHTYSHPDLRRLSNAAIRSEIARGVMTGCPYFRPPYGAWDGPRGRIAAIAAEFGLQPMLWDVDSRDWAGAPANEIAALSKARGGVILLHLHGTHTAEAIRLIG
jgi:peptidoglycan/xylan/chitin deacetylase (PgdA/CDA1 family)